MGPADMGFWGPTCPTSLGGVVEKFPELTKVVLFRFIFFACHFHTFHMMPKTCAKASQERSCFFCLIKHQTSPNCRCGSE